MSASRPLSLRLADDAVEDVFLHTLDCEVLSACGSVRLKVKRSRDTGARVFLCVQVLATGEDDAVMLDKAQAVFLRDGITAVVGSLKPDHDAVLRGVPFKAREATTVARALNAYVEEG